MNEDPDLLFGLVVSLLLAILGSVALLITRRNRTTLQFQVRLFLIAFAARVAMSVVIYQFGLVRLLGDEDSSGWWAGVSLQHEWIRRRIALFDLPSVLTGAFEGHHRGYGYLLGAFFYITDSPNRLPAAALNCFFGALTVVFAYRIARALFSEWVAVRVGWWACLFPSLIIWSAQTVKEPVVILLETLALYGCLNLKLSGFSVRYILLCGLAILLVIPFRFYAAYIAGAAIALSLALPQITKGKWSIGAVVGMAALVIPVVIISGVLVQHEAEFERFDLKQIQRFRVNVARGTGSGIESDYDLHTPSGFSLATLVGGAHLLLAPFPWQLAAGSSRMLVTLPEMLVWWWLFFVGGIPGLWYAVRKRFDDIQPLLFFTVGLGLLYSLMFGNIGLIFRQRAQLLPYLLIFSAVGLEQRALRKLAARKARALPIGSERWAQVSVQPSIPLQPVSDVQPFIRKS